ncbi:uncharacterized protein BX663DRAFT_494217 [Cokeromyces recurvatus]|uniref:uncharacterized protein n=1 Tax=Cokeromyces recurvatus TaxID=90255 RepID=UPI00222035E7|nr:uncharacterized protein BX663DRAFT_494217 [Cokeromyces recurvatus]KAI7906921.1 hypothetical protein BX663DRAFT_494217 [Cokeromyces recurvatus]
MSSLLSFQLRQEKEQQQRMLIVEKGHQTSTANGLPSPPNSFCGEESSTSAAPVVLINEQKKRRDSLQTVFNDMSIKDYSTSMPENYTIDHSLIPLPVSHKRSLHATSSTSTTATATAAATGGLTIRNRRQSEINISSSAGRRKSTFTINRGLSESFSGQYRCNDCGKSYKSPNCLQKHRWEHSEEWEITKKLPLTKHQQVQMLEAAAILINMERRGSEKKLYTQSDDISQQIENRKTIISDEEEDEVESIVIDDEDGDLENLSIGSNESSGIFIEDL